MRTKWIAQQGLHLIQAFLYVIGLKTSNARLEVGSYHDVEASLQPLREHVCHPRWKIILSKTNCKTVSFGTE